MSTVQTSREEVRAFFNAAGRPAGPEDAALVAVWRAPAERDGLAVREWLALEPARPRRLAKYEPGQRRAPKGGAEGGRWVDEGEGGRAERAKATHKPATAKKQRRGEAEQARIATALGGENTGDNEPFDVIAGRHAIEVKVVMDNDNNKITVHPSSLARKLAAARSGRLRPHTVAIDVRSGQRSYYYREGIGSFRLGAMRRVSLMELRRVVLR